MTDSTAPVQPAPTGDKPAEQEHQEQQTFTQADVDRIVSERVQRERAKFADYADLKKQAEGAKTAEERIATLEAETAKANRDRLAARIAAQHGITTEDADLFLTGADEETLTAQAKRLSDRDSERRKSGNVVPKQGANPTPPADDRRAFVRALTGRD